MSGYVLGAEAEFDLDEIWEYIAADNLDAADRWIGKLFDAFEALGQTPGMGHRRGDLTAYPVLTPIAQREGRRNHPKNVRPAPGLGMRDNTMGFRVQTKISPHLLYCPCTCAR
ncbi:MAG: type II toxin-antitoxin system RelE/ParE family toxin [Bryobacteraceae bacterium]